MTQPVDPIPLPQPFPPNQVLLPFQPPVSYAGGQFNNGKTLLQLLESGVAAVEMQAATITGDVANKPPDDVRVTYYNKTYQPIGEINDYMSLTFQLARNRVASAEIVLKGIDPAVPALLNCPQTTVPITIETGTIRWSGRVFSCEDKFADRVNTVVVTCISDYAWLDKILCWVCAPWGNLGGTDPAETADPIFYYRSRSSSRPRPCSSDRLSRV